MCFDAWSYFLRRASHLVSCASQCGSQVPSYRRQFLHMAACLALDSNSPYNRLCTDWCSFINCYQQATALDENLTHFLDHGRLYETLINWSLIDFVTLLIILDSFLFSDFSSAQQSNFLVKFAFWASDLLFAFSLPAIQSPSSLSGYPWQATHRPFYQSR